LNAVKLLFCNLSRTRIAIITAASLFILRNPLFSIEAGKKSDELLQVTNLWTVHFRFTPEQWEAMEPKQNGGGFLGRMMGPGGPRNRGGGPGGPGGFGPGMLLTSSFLKEGDQNSDQKISRDEFAALSEKWFQQWDKDKREKLNEDNLRDGLGKNIGMPPGGPGPGGRGPGLWLQGTEGKRNGLASAAGIEFKYVHADLEIDGKKFTNVAVRYKGNGTFMESRGSLKKSLKVALGEYVKGQKLAGLSKINFHNCVTDPSYMNEVLSHRVFRDARVPSPKTAYARVYITVPGQHEKEYFGLYSVVEDVDSHFADEWFGSKNGAILKPVTPAPFTDLGDDWKSYNQTYDPKTGLSDAEKKRLIDFCKLVSHAGDEEFSAKLADYLDLDNFSRFMAVTTWLSTLDSILGVGQNYYVYLHPKTGKLHFIPWDLDHSFGQFPMMGTQDLREQLSIDKPWQGENRFLERIYKVEASKKLYHARLAEFSDTIFKPERLMQQVDEVAAAIRPAVKAESGAKLTRFDKVVAGENVPPRFFGQEGGGPGGPGGFMQPAKPIKGFVKVRTESVKEQLNGQSKGETLNFGFGPGGGGRGRPGGRGGPGNTLFGPETFLASAFMRELDADKNGELTRDEFVNGFKKWFESWDSAKTGSITEEQLRDGLNDNFRPPGFGGRGGWFGGPPPRGE